MRKNKSSCITSAGLTGTGTMKNKTPFSSTRAGRRRDAKNLGRNKRSFCLKLAGLAALVLLLGLIFRPDRSEAQTCTNSPTQCATPGNDGAGGTLTGTVNTYFAGNRTTAAGSTSIRVNASVGANVGI